MGFSFALGLIQRMKKVWGRSAFMGAVQWLEGMGFLRHLDEKNNIMECLQSFSCMSGKKKV
jgi:hypothetical protein